MERLRRVVYFEALARSVKQRSSSAPLKSDEQNCIATMEYLTKKPGRFTDQDREKFDASAKKLEHLNNLPGLGINEKERVAIVTALNMGSGHWFVCPRGHPYLITEVCVVDLQIDLFYFVNLVWWSKSREHLSRM